MEDMPNPEIVTEISASEWAAFKTLWIYGSRISYLSGLPLNPFSVTKFWLSCFAHVLSKNKYPYFRFYLRNIIFLTPGEHALLDQGTEDQRKEYSKLVKTAVWQKVYDLRDELLSEHQSLFPSRRGIMIGIKYSDSEVQDVIRKLNGIIVANFMRHLALKPHNRISYKNNPKHKNNNNNKPPVKTS